MASWRTLVVLWLAWLASLLVFQALGPARFSVERPDYVLEWTPGDTSGHRPSQEPTLAEPFLNTQVAFDSEYYLSIATVGYDDALPGALRPPGGGPPIPLNYAFFPLYPYLIRALVVPLSVLGLSPIATATLAGVALSALGALAAMTALYDLSRGQLGEAGGVRTAFYLLIFPTGFFLAQVYTEGVFLALAFGSLALMARGRLGWASLLAALAVWTRGVGVALALPLAWTWLSAVRRAPAPRWRDWAGAAWVALPLGAYALWHFSTQGTLFPVLEEYYFGRKLLWLDTSLQSWGRALLAITGPNRQTAVYFALEFAASLLALAGCLATLRRYPAVALFSLVALLIPLTSGYLQSMQRYVLAVPSLFLMLGALGQRPAFDRAWSLASTLLMALLALLFSFDFWVA